MHGGNKSGRGHKGERQRGNRPRLGFEGGQTPFYLLIPKYGYNEGHRWESYLNCLRPGTMVIKTFPLCFCV